MSLLRDRSFFAASLAHFFVDLVNSQYPLLLAILSIPLGLTNAMIGLLSMMYSLSGSLSQPVFGTLADKFGTRRVAAGGVIFMSLAFAMALILPGVAALFFLMGTGIGSGAFHPAGTSEASRRGKHHLANLENTATSIFFVFGQSGLFLGPVLGGPLLDRWGPHGLLLLLLLLFPCGVYLARYLEQLQRPASEGELQDDALPIKRAATQRPPAAFFGLITLRAWIQMSMMAFLPKYLSDLGFRPGLFGPIAALFMGGSAVGGVMGGWLSDRFGNRIVVVSALVSAVLPLALFPRAHDALVLSLLSFVAGALIGAPHSIFIVQAQHMMPGKTGAASGLILGFTFASGSIGSVVSGVIADRAGFELVFLSLAGIAFLAGWIGFSLRIFKTRLSVPVSPVPEI